MPRAAGSRRGGDISTPRGRGRARAGRGRRDAPIGNLPRAVALPARERADASPSMTWESGGGRGVDPSAFAQRGARRGRIRYRRRAISTRCPGGGAYLDITGSPRPTRGARVRARAGSTRAASRRAHRASAFAPGTAIPWAAADIFQSGAKTANCTFNQPYELKPSQGGDVHASPRRVAGVPTRPHRAHASTRRARTRRIARAGRPDGRRRRALERSGAPEKAAGAEPVSFAPSERRAARRKKADLPRVTASERV